MVALRNRTKRSWQFFKSHPLIFGLSLFVLLLLLFVSNIFGFTFGFILIFFVTPVFYYWAWKKVGRPIKNFSDNLLGLSSKPKRK